MNKRILVVEDQPDNRQIIRDMLAPTDYEITEVEDGEQALAVIAKQRPDLILMDIQLPIMDGYTAVSRIKADPALRSIPIIAVTSYALNGEEKKARAAGCDPGLIAAVHESAYGPLRRIAVRWLTVAFGAKRTSIDFGALWICCE
jgi:two-component system cell cycle response regulator DivK